MGFIRQGSLTYGARTSSYRASVNATDTGTTPAGVQKVTANVSNITTGETAIELTAGSHTIYPATSYGWRSDPPTPNTTLTEGTKHGRSPRPTAPGTLPRRLPNWSGETTMQGVIDGNASPESFTLPRPHHSDRERGGDRLGRERDQQLPVREPDLRGELDALHHRGTTNTITMTLGTPSANATTVDANNSLRRNPGVGMTDRAGNPLATTAFTEGGTADGDW